MQVEKEVLLPNQAVEMPSVAQCVVGRPHTHAYMLASRVTGAHRFWGAPQVRCGFLCLCLRTQTRGLSFLRASSTVWTHAWHPIVAQLVPKMPSPDL